MSNVYIDFHVLQTVPPSCVNRDDVGSPKTSYYGGVTRARVSSQSWKRAIREKFKDGYEKEELGFRTRNVKKLIQDKMELIDPEFNDSEKLSEIVASIVDIKFDKVLFFISDKQVTSLAEKALGDKEILMEKMSSSEKKRYKTIFEEILKENPSIDIILFGRMVASNKLLNIDAAAQVAHSISTHAVKTEYDYFTALDDYEEGSGAGHLDTTEFYSCTLYRYASLNVSEVLKNCSVDETKRAVKMFAKAFTYSMPTGKQNSFANWTMPYALYVTVRYDQPINMSGAFEKPVRAKSDGYEYESADSFSKYVETLYSTFASKPEFSFVVAGDGILDELEEKVSFSDMMEKLSDCVPEQE